MKSNNSPINHPAKSANLAGTPINTALAILSTVIGAGFASGREVVEFFTRFGAFSWVGIAVAAACFAFLAASIMKLSGRIGCGSWSDLAAAALGKAGGAAASALYAVIMIITASAMASGIGEVTAILLPVQHARIIGTLASVIICGFAATKGIRALAAGASFLLPICILLYIVIGRTPAQTHALAMPLPNPIISIPYAIGYACMNTTLCCCILCEVGRTDEKRHKKISILFSIMLFILTAACNAVLLPRLAQIVNEPLPIVKLSGGNTASMAFASASLLLAMATTLTALIRSVTQILTPKKETRLPLKRKERLRVPRIRATYVRAPELIVPAICGALGLFEFNMLVGKAYPIMGYAAAAALVIILAAGMRKLRSNK
ncbi:MAG: GerAB/ArcD/ProY family transporter [Oscillospiraceae bacterium]|jgi:uncharacterized membrane protein YkvI|nr:GerAB/ArcD/ProY family transporter [Oscillospiraceae bacterium]